LRKVFEDIYRFKVCEQRLNSQKRVDHQLRKHLSNFVHDGDADNALLIVYYAGHGLPEGGKLWLQGYIRIERV
jgi:hypothetical protein